MSEKDEKAQNSVRRFLKARKIKRGAGKGADGKHPCDRGDGTLDFDCLLKTGNDTFALFYAEWCPFSMAFLPHFKKHAEGRGRDCVRLTLEEREALFDKYKVEYMPTVIYFKKGRPARRLDAAPHVGLTEKQLLDLLANCK
jgi:thiol-disulfide isomerase/thioredoxin